MRVFQHAPCSYKIELLRAIDSLQGKLGIVVTVSLCGAAPGVLSPKFGEQVARGPRFAGCTAIKLLRATEDLQGT